MSNKSRVLIVILSIAIFITTGVLLVLINFIFSEITKDEDELITTTTAALIDKKFRGYKTYELKDSQQFSYDIEKNYEFIFETNDSYDLNNDYNNKTYNYTVRIENDVLMFRESIYDTKLDVYKETGKTYQFNTDNKVVSFMIPKGEELSRYSIIVMDEKKDIYVYENDEKNKSITKIISNIKKVKTISKAKRIGYYNYSNIPYLKNKDYELIYEDELGNIRYLNDKNSLFFENAYYRIIGYPLGDESILVQKDGKMTFSSNNEVVLNNGNNHIIYRGSFYKYDEVNLNQDVYILGTDNYLYIINNFDKSSLPVLNKVSAKKVKRIGSQVMKDDKNFATSFHKILVEYEDGELFELDSVSDLEILE